MTRILALLSAAAFIFVGTQFLEQCMARAPNSQESATVFQPPACYLDSASRTLRPEKGVVLVSASQALRQRETRPINPRLSRAIDQVPAQTVRARVIWHTAQHRDLVISTGNAVLSGEVIGSVVSPAVIRREVFELQPGYWLLI